MGRESDAFSPILRRFGVPRDGVLIVHSGIAQLSRQGFTAEGIIESLLDHAASGNVFMPTMTWRTVSPANPEWDEIRTPSHTGVLSEIFRARYAVARSIHPTHSVAGWGPNAPVLLARHHVDDTPVSGNSPYALMRDFPTYVLMIGVGLESCTAIHLAEETINADLYCRRPEETEVYRCRDRHGNEHVVKTRRHRRLDRDFPHFALPLQAKNAIEQGAVCGCPYRIFSLAALLREVFAALIEDPRATLRRSE